MKDYGKMSDFEINKAVAINRGGYQGHVEHMKHGVKESNRDSHGILYFERDYCNNPSDAWPIIDSCGICVEFDLSEDGESRWCNASNVSKKISVKYQKNALRAAMIAYLMMKDEDK